MRSFVFACVALLLSSAAMAQASGDIEWLTFEEAVAANEKEPRPMFIDIYTDWCGWCKRMDATTFKHPVIEDLMGTQFYAVKLDAEQKADIKFGEYTFTYQADAGKRGTHELALSLLEGNMSYPSFVLMDTEVQRLQVLKGYQQPKQLEMVLAYYGNDTYKTKKPEEFRSEFKSGIQE